MSFSLMFLLRISVPFSLMIVCKGLMDVATPMISTTELLIKVGSSLIGVNAKLCSSREGSSSKKGSMVKVLPRLISQSFFK